MKWSRFDTYEANMYTKYDKKWIEGETSGIAEIVDSRSPLKLPLTLFIHLVVQCTHVLYVFDLKKSKKKSSRQIALNAAAVNFHNKVAWCRT